MLDEKQISISITVDSILTNITHFDYIRPRKLKQCWQSLLLIILIFCFVLELKLVIPNSQQVFADKEALT